MARFEVFKLGPAGRTHIQHREGSSAEAVLDAFTKDRGQGDLVDWDKVSNQPIIYAGADRIFAIPETVVTEAAETDPTHHWFGTPRYTGSD
jgi:hypothetical protein